MAAAILAICTLCGCLNEIPKPEEKAADDKQPNKTGIIGQRTDDIGELQQGDQVLESQMPTGVNPLSGGLNVYGPALEKLSKTQIHQALELYRAQYGEYPKSHDEFMTQIIKANKIKLPILPGDRVYKYDVANHKLVVVAGPNQLQQ